MTLIGVLTAFAVLGGLVLAAVLFMQRGREGVDLSLGGLLRAYLYVGSLAKDDAHTDAIYLIDKVGRERWLIHSDFDPDELAGALRTLLRE